MPKVNRIQKLNALINARECDIHLRVHAPGLLLATYTYEWDAETCCKFTWLSEVAESLQPAFRSLLKRRGLLPVGHLGTPEKPHVQDLMTADPLTSAGRRWDRLMPGMEPKWVRCYDNGGRSFDRYTVVFSGKAAREDGGPGRPNQYPYLGMSEHPYHPQGFGQRGCSDNSACDTLGGVWPPAIGRKNHLGTRINFAELPKDCQRVVIDDYLAIWKL